MNDLVSIVVPIYNVEKYLDRCILSIINQTYKNLEILLMNDGSTDNSLEICKKYQKKDKRIKIFSRENRGLLYTRIDGVKKSTGKYLMFVDSDDYIDSDMIKYMLDSMKKNSVQMLKCGYKYSYDNSIIFPVTNENIFIIDDTDIAFNYLITKDVHSIWAELINNDILKKHVDEIDYTIANGEDIHFNMIMYKYYDKIGYINKNFYNYEYDINSMSHGFEINKVKNKIYDLLKVYTYFIDAMENENKRAISNKAIITISNNIMSLSNSKKIKYKDVLNLSKKIKRNKINLMIRKNISLKYVKGKNTKESIMGKIFYLNMLRMYSFIIYLKNRIKGRRKK